LNFVKVCVKILKWYTAVFDLYLQGVDIVRPWNQRMVRLQLNSKTKG